MTINLFELYIPHEYNTLSRADFGCPDCDNTGAGLSCPLGQKTVRMSALFSAQRHIHLGYYVKTRLYDMSFGDGGIAEYQT